MNPPKYEDKTAHLNIGDRVVIIAAPRSAPEISGWYGTIVAKTEPGIPPGVQVDVDGIEKLPYMKGRPVKLWFWPEFVRPFSLIETLSELPVD